MRIGLNVEHGVMHVGSTIVTKYGMELNSEDYALDQIDVDEAVEILKYWVDDAEDHWDNLVGVLEKAIEEMEVRSERRYWVELDGSVYSGTLDMTGPTWREVSKEEALNILSGE